VLLREKHDPLSAEENMAQRKTFRPERKAARTVGETLDIEEFHDCTVPVTK
jgi:hypothetical protein